MNEQTMLRDWFMCHPEEICAPYQSLVSLVNKIKSSWKHTSIHSEEELSSSQETKKTRGTSMPKITVTLLPAY